MPKKAAPSAVIIGLVLLLAGAGFYLLARPPESVYFIFRYAPFLSTYDQSGGFFESRVFGSLPMFFHVSAFSLLTAGCLPTGRVTAAASCFFWLMINVVFEVLQKYNHSAAALIPGWFDGFPWLESFRPYFEHGSFDLNDILFAGFGALTGFLILLYLMVREEKNAVK